MKHRKTTAFLGLLLCAALLLSLGGCFLTKQHREAQLGEKLVLKHPSKTLTSVAETREDPALCALPVSVTVTYADDYTCEHEHASTLDPALLQEKMAYYTPLNQSRHRELGIAQDQTPDISYTPILQYYYSSYADFLEADYGKLISGNTDEILTVTVEFITPEMETGSH